MERGIFEIVDTESLVPANHLLRKIDAAVDFNEIYDMVEPLYCTDNGRPSVDPVVLFKMVIIQHLYGLSSLRRTAEEVSLNVAYRWFLGYRLQEETPHFSTISYNFRHRFTSAVGTIDWDSVKAVWHPRRAQNWNLCSIDIQHGLYPCERRKL